MSSSSSPVNLDISDNSDLIENGAFDISDIVSDNRSNATIGIANEISTSLIRQVSEYVRDHPEVNVIHIFTSKGPNFKQESKVGLSSNRGG